MPHSLVKLDQEALQLKNSGRISEAAELLSVIVEQQPNWGNGLGFLNLARCYEDLGQFEKAAKSYRAALQYAPASELILGGYASFLYLHGKPEDAFDAYVKLLRGYWDENSEDDISSCMLALNALGGRLGWSRDMVAEKLRHRLDNRGGSETVW